MLGDVGPEWMLLRLPAATVGLFRAAFAVEMRAYRIAIAEHLQQVRYVRALFDDDAVGDGVAEVPHAKSRPM